MATKVINKVLFFGDQTVEKLPGVRALAQKAQTTAVAARFLQAAADAIQSELGELPADERADVDDFDTILGLAEANAAREEPNETIATVLMAVVRMGELIIYVEEDPTILGTATVGAGGRAEVLGLCTGQVPAAVALAARNSSELFALAVEATRIAFRLGREICTNSRRIDPSGGPWATTLVGVQVAQVQGLLDEFHTQTQVPLARRICIGVEAHGWMTVFGPPSTQARLWAWSSELAKASRIPTEARGGVHMPTAPLIDTARVLGTSALLATPLDTDKARMHSTVDGALLQAATFGEMLLAVIPLIVHQPIRFNGTLDAVIQALAPGAPVRLVELGPSGHTPSVQRAISERGFAVTLATHAASPAAAAASPSAGLRGGSGAVAVVGMAGRFPGAGSAGVDGFWEVLHKGERHVTEIPSSRFDLDTYYDATGQKPGSTLARHGAFLDQPGLFDNRLFNVSPREAMQMDPVHRLLLTASYEALESAGYYPGATPSTRSDRIATYLGQASDDHREILANEGVDIYYIPGIVRAFAPGRLNYHYKWGGGAFAVDSACATSITATVLACRALLNRDCDTALAGAGSVLSSPWPFAGLSRGGFLSLGPGGCNTFHDEADGYTRGEAVGVVVLKRLEDALAENDNILGVIPGGARNYSSDASSITHPSASAQQRLYKDILHKTATDPNTISYVEMHGTGTQAGDSMEMSSVLSTFGRGRTKEHPLVVGAVKANIGHGEAAAGISSLLKVLLMFRERRIPPQPGVPFKINSKFPDLDRLNVRIATDLSSLHPAADGKRRAFVNSFDAAGGNSCVLIEEAPPKPHKTLDPRPCHIITLSARTPASLSGNRQRLIDYLNKHPAVRLADVAYTTTARRMHGPLRAAFVVNSTAELSDRLSANVSAASPKARGPSANLVFTFTGQGSLYAGMGKDLWKHSASFRREVESLQALADLQGLPKFAHLIAQGAVDVSTASPAQSQLAIVALEIALARLFQSLDVRPDALVGHSLGEYAALCVAGVLSMSDTLHLVATRAAIMEKKLTAHEYAMLAAAEAEPSMRQRLDSGEWSSCEIACINAPSMTVVSGTISHLKSLQEELKVSGARSTLLPVPYGFHSKQIEPVLDDFEQCAQGVVFSKPTIPIASTLLGKVVTESNIFSPNYLRRQAREPVAFVPALEACKAAGLVNDGTIFVEMGPEPICNGLVRATLSVPHERLLASLKSKDDDWTVFCTSLATLYSAGIPVNWPDYHKDFVKHLSLLDLPHYAFDEKEFWVPFRERLVESGRELVTAPATKSAPAVAGFPTTSLQHFKSTSQDGNVLSIIFETDPYESDMVEAIRGHVVAGVTICPSSIFCDMALSVAKFAHQTLQPKTTLPALSISDLAITHPLVVSNKPRQQTIEISAKIPDSKKPAVCIVTFKLRNKTGIHSMGGCSISYEGNVDAKKTLSREIFFVRARIEALQERATNGLGHRLFKPVIYSLFQNLVDYALAYQGLEEVILDSDFRDAVGTVKLPANSGKGNFLFKAHLLDAVVHLAGWFLNCGLKYPKDIAFLSIGIDKWHLFQPLSEKSTYTSYVRMEETQGGSLLVGDVYVFSGDTLVCVALGVKSKKMKKATLVSLFQAADPTSQQHGRADRSFTTASVPVISHDTGSQSPPDTASSGVDQSSDELASTATSVSDDDAAGSGTVEKLLAVVAAETGAELSELTPDVMFADLGVDSLMVIAVIAAIRNETGVELPGSFFFDHPTVGEAIAALGGQPAPKGAVEDEEDDPESEDGDEDGDEDAEESAVSEPAREIQERSSDAEMASLKPAPIQNRARVILMHGSPSSTKTPVFILADATGTVSSFMTLPALAGDRKVYGIESPFAREGSDYNCSVEALAELYAAAIRETDTSGPYVLVGFSAGAVHAFEVCKQLSSNILSLILIDMPAPAGTELAGKVKLPTPLTLEQLQQAGIFTSSISAPLSTALSMPKPRKQHLCATVKSLLAYHPDALPASAQPQHGTVLITGSTGPVLHPAKDTDVPLVSWARAHWDKNADESKGWAALVGGHVSSFHVDSSHVDMFRYPKVKAVAAVYKKVVEDMFAQLG